MANLQVRKSIVGTIRLDYGGRGYFPRWEFPDWRRPRTDEEDRLLSELVKGLDLRPGQCKRVKLVEVPDD